VDRTLAMLVNAAVDAVFLRVASPKDIETAILKGVNYPKGLLAWGDDIGAAEILRRLTALQVEYGEERYRASALLRRRIADGRPLLA
jgi:3-hydroxybutyryl-CoA dehydrogenase